MLVESSLVALVFLILLEPVCHDLSSEVSVMVESLSACRYDDIYLAIKGKK